MTRSYTSVAVGLMLSVVAINGTARADGDGMDAIRAATAKYQDIKVALAEGYIPDPSGACVSAAAEGLPPELGAMGIHYLNPGLLGLAPPGGRVSGNGLVTDFTTPSVLLYEPQVDGSLKLLGVENLIFQAAWKEAGYMAPPSYGDQVWDTMADMSGTGGDEAHGFEPHYDLHVWTERENPAGPFVAFNPAASCPAG